MDALNANACGVDFDLVDVTGKEAAALRAALNEELGFFPARLDDESIAEYRRSTAEQAERLARYDRKYGGPGGSHYNQFRHLRPKGR